MSKFYLINASKISRYGKNKSINFVDEYKYCLLDTLGNNVNNKEYLKNINFIFEYIDDPYLDSGLYEISNMIPISLFNNKRSGEGMFINDNNIESIDDLIEEDSITTFKDYYKTVNKDEYNYLLNSLKEFYHRGKLAKDNMCGFEKKM